MNKHLLGLLLCIVVTAGCAPKPPAGEVNNPLPLQNKSFARNWDTSLIGGASTRVTQLYLSDKYVFAYRQDGSASVINRATGELLSVDYPKEGGEQLRPPVVLDDRIVYPTTIYLDVFDVKGRHIAHPTLPTDDVSKPFSQTLRYPIRSNAVGGNRVLYFGADFPTSGRVVAVDMTRPYVPELWTLMEPDAGIPAAPALVKDILFVATSKGTVAAVATDSREPLWTLPSGVFGTYGGVLGDLAADTTGVYVASTDTKLYCLSRTTGKVKWQYFAGAPLIAGPVITKDMVYEQVPGAGLAALDKNLISSAAKPAFDRAPRWVASDASKFLSEDDKYVYVRTNKNQIAALDKKTGQRQFISQRADLTVFATNTKGDGIVYVATSGAAVIAVRPVLVPGQVGELVLAPAPRQSMAVADAR